MAIEDRLPQNRTLRTRHPLSRVRRELERLRNALSADALANEDFALGRLPRPSTAEPIAEIDEALTEWKRLDDLKIALRQQQRHVATRLTAFMEFVVLISMPVRNLDRKPRRRLTPAQRILATAKLRETRRLAARWARGRRRSSKRRPTAASGAGRLAWPCRRPRSRTCAARSRR